MDASTLARYAPNRWHISFRSKLLLSLTGSIGLLLGLTLVLIQRETSRQIRTFVEQETTESKRAFAEIEQLRQQELARLGLRFSASPRLPAALQAALEEDNPAVLAEAAAYEIDLAGIDQALAAFTNLDGRHVLTLLQGEPTAAGDPLSPDVLDQLFRERQSSIFGYRVVDARLFATHTVLLELFGPVGTLTLGFPVDHAIATQLGDVLNGEVCFVASGRCAAGTGRALESSALQEAMIATAGDADVRRFTWRGERMALVSSPLVGGEDVGGSWVIASSLEPVLAPFDHIRRAMAIAGLAVLGFALLLGLVLSRGLTRPVRALVRATAKVGRGDYNVRVPVTSHDEMGLLARAFNEMTEGLRLKEEYRGVLDKVVSRDVAEELLKGEIKLGGETREVTCLFADIRGFSTIAETMEPQAVIVMLNEFMERATAAVEAEGGVVDKYVGDEVMAVFGAPVSYGDDRGRAIRAALAIRSSIDELNELRERRGDPAIAVGIGINSGPAVAGNMGSAHRLNYTVLGDSVNIASRLCSEAGPSQILATEATCRGVEEPIDAHPVGDLRLKGLSVPVRAYEIAPRPTPATQRRTAGGRTALLLWALLAASATGAYGQGLPDPPTLSELGVYYQSPGGFLQIAVSGRLDIDAYVPQEDPAWIIPETHPFIGGQARAFIDVFAGDRLYALTELRADRGEPPTRGAASARVQQAFLRLTPLPRYPVSLQAGIFASPFGSYSQRHHTPADPLIRPPLLHDFRTMVSSGMLPATNDGFIGWKDEPERFRPIGAPIVWGVPYQAGAMLFGRLGWLDFRLAAMNSAPSSEPEDWDFDPNQTRAPSYVAHVAVQPLPELRLGLSYNIGPYLQEHPVGAFPAGKGVNDYDQEIWGFEATYTRGRVELRSELLLDRWEVPHVLEDPRDLSYYVEGSVDVSTGLFVAARYNAIHFNRIVQTGYGGVYGAGVDAGRAPWDYDIHRVQVGGGYRLSRNLEIRAEYLRNVTVGTPDPRDDLLAVQWWWAF